MFTGGRKPRPCFHGPLAKRFIFYDPLPAGRKCRSVKTRKGRQNEKSTCNRTGHADDAGPGRLRTEQRTCCDAHRGTPRRNAGQGDDSNGAVPIKDSDGEFANGYDVMMAKKICEANGWTLEVIKADWDSLVPGVQSRTYDAVIAGQSMTAERSEQVDFAGPYLYATIVCLTRSDSPYASAKGINDLAGGTCTSQSATIWYDTMLPQIPDAKIQPAAESAPAMLMALETGTVDFVCTDMPTALGAVRAYPDMVLLDFAGSDNDFTADAGDVNIGVSVFKGNTVLLDAINAVLSPMTADDFNAMMDQAIAVQPSEA